MCYFKIPLTFLHSIQKYTSSGCFSSPPTLGISGFSTAAAAHSPGFHLFVFLWKGPHATLYLFTGCLKICYLSYRRLVHAGCRCPFKYLFCEHSFPLRTVFSLSLMMSFGRDLKFLMTASLLLNSSTVIVQVICLENSPLLWRFSVIFWRFILLCLHP